MKKIIAMLALLTATPALSFTGNSLNEWLKNDDLRPRATAFIYGVAMGYVEGQSLSEDTAIKICFPAGVTASQMTSMVEKQLQDVPSANHQPAHFLTIIVFLKAFGCAKEDKK